jgi:transposase
MDMPELPVIETKDTHKIGRKSARRPRVELLTRSERRRRWSIEKKQEIVAESLRPDTTPTEVARKYAISSGLLYTWRQQLLHGCVDPKIRSAPTFAQVEIAAALPDLTVPDCWQLSSRNSGSDKAATVRVGDGHISASAFASPYR